MKEIEAYTPITDQEEEAMVLGTILNRRETFHVVDSILDVDAFTLPVHKSVFKACKELAKEGSPIDAMLVRNKIEASGESIQLAGIASLMANSIVFDDELEAHSRRLKELSIRRSLRQVATRLAIASTCETEELDNVIEYAVDALSTNGICDCGIKDMTSNLNEVYNTMLENQDPNKKIGTPTGFEEYDYKNGGLFGSDLVIVAADSSQGKTSFALKLIQSSAEAGDPVAVYSLEMRGTQLTARLLSMNSGVPSNMILRNHLCKEEFDKASYAINSLMRLPIYTDDHSSSMIDGIISSIRSMVIKKGIKVAVIDFLQILTVNQRIYNQDAFLGEVCRKLKNLAKDLDICIVALSQLSRSSESNEPTLRRLRGSGQMNEAADVTILLYRPEVYNERYPEPYKNVETRGTALVRVAKARNSQPFDFIVGFDSTTTRFYNLDGRIPEISVQNHRTESAPF